MKNLLLLLIVILCQNMYSFSQTNQAQNQKKYLTRLKGSWTLSDWRDRDKKYRDEDGYFIFSDNNIVTAIYRNDTIRGSFVYNAQKNPHWIDFKWKSNTGKITQTHGIIKWQDDVTARLNLVQKNVLRPTKFVDDPDLDKSGILRKQGNTSGNSNNSLLKENLIKGKWDITLLYEADKYKSGKKYQTYTFHEDNRYILSGTGFIPGTSGGGRYELNTDKFPYWIDFYPDEGAKTMGLIQEYLNGYKLQIFNKHFEDGHPIRFYDVEYNDPSIINFNSNFLYIERSSN
ncbi:MAG: hypothetical protein ACOYKE_00105 [Ferruginibacter sp.]